MPISSNVATTQAPNFTGNLTDYKVITDGSLHMFFSVREVSTERLVVTTDEDGNPTGLGYAYGSQGLDSRANKGVRRPYRGISIKKESFASLAVVSSQTSFSTKGIKNSSEASDVAFTSNFLINSVAETRHEKHQPVSTFGKDYVYFFGEQPRQMTFNCTLLNTDNFRWEEEWWYNYEHYFRGTRLAASSEQVRIRVDESIIYGYMITCSTNKDSNNPHSVTLSFTVHVTDVVSTRPSKIGSHLIQEDAADAYGYVDMNPADLGSNLPTFAIGKDSQAIRDYNIKKYLKDSAEPTGAIARLKNSVKDGIDTISTAYHEFVDFIYGRNIVLPADAAYAQFSSGNPAFAEGGAAYETFQSKGLKGFSANYGKSRSQFKNVINNRSGSYTNNYDEYPFQAVLATAERTGDLPASNSVSDDVISAISESFNIPKEDLTANEDMAFETTAQEKISKATRDARISKIAFAAFQISVATANSAVRKNAYSEGRYKVFPNEFASMGLIDLQYTE